MGIRFDKVPSLGNLDFTHSLGCLSNAKDKIACFNFILGSFALKIITKCQNALINYLISLDSQLTNFDSSLIN